jgi:glucan-binding YG repeat protein
LAGADKSVDDISKKVVGTYRPNTSVIAPSEIRLGMKALEKPSAISNQQGKKLVKNKISTPRIAGKKSLEKPSAISKLQEEKVAKNKIFTLPTAGKQALKKPSSSISKQQEKEIVVNKTSKRPSRKRSKRNTKETLRSNSWAMDNPNYKFRKSLLTNGDLKKAAPFTRKLQKFYMQRGK